MEYRQKVTERERSEGALAPEGLEHAVEVFGEAGFLVLEGAFAPSIVDGLRRAYVSQYGEMTAAEMAASAREPGSPVLEVGADRHEIVIQLVDEFRQENVLASPLIQGVLRRLLGEGFHLSGATVVAAHPGSPQQDIHRDHEGLFPEDAALSMQLPTYAVNVAVPLIDVDQSRGPTAVWVGSHLGEQRGKPESIWPVLPETKRGDCMLIDYRTLHRGTPNASDTTRPILYLTYARKWFFDQVNHLSRASLDMPMAEGEPLPEALRTLLTRAIAENRKARARQRTAREKR